MRLIKVIGGLVAVVLVAAVGFLVFAHRSEIAAADPPASFDRELVARGARLAAIGNCRSCHTVAGGLAYAGGVPIPTAFGTIHGTNITPDRDTGIGAWSQEAFVRSMREGVDRAGNHLYPAFPYDHFTKLEDGDLAALYAYLMTRPAVRATAPTNDLAFPAGFRPLLAGWKLLFFQPGRFEDDPRSSPELNRGAYLADALAHCGACHTPRNGLGAQQGRHEFAGGVSASWAAPAIDESNPAPVPWTSESLHAYLRHGRAEHHGVAAGPMQDVTRNLAEAEDDDVRVLAAYVATRMGAPSQEREERAKGLIATAAERLPFNVPVPETMGAAAARLPAGAALYAGACAVCHDAGRTGGMDGIDLALATGVQLASARNFLNVVLDGIHSPRHPSAVLMPGFAGALTDEQIVELAAYVRATYSNQPPWPDIAATLRDIRLNRIAANAEARP
ncbi:cytochrome c [Xanthobacteraceae bacterium Astr-EGSB]|uniref:cytochrome c n=1 Tax=Astrobacterium formosum TaxID=3069710 RepID=UPI0027B584D1|nr:cytochrome c [Xanthobacteraceae bacterium Astr-EGSB]